MFRVASSASLGVQHVALRRSTTAIHPRSLAAGPVHHAPLTRALLTKLDAGVKRHFHAVGASPVPMQPAVQQQIFSPTKTPLAISSRLIAPFMPHRAITGGTRIKERTRTRTQEETRNTTIVPTEEQSVAGQQQQQQQQQYPPQGEQIPVDARSTAEVVLADPGLSEFLGRVYRTTGVSVAATLGIAYTLSHLIGIPVAAMGALQFGGFIVSIGSLIALLMGKRPVTQRRPEDPSKLYTENSTFRQGAYSAFILGNALSIAPYIQIVSNISPVIVPAAVAATSLSMLGASWLAYAKPNGSFLKFAAPLTGALFGLVGMQLVSMGAYYFLGPNAFSSSMATVYPYLGIGLFTAFQAVDTHTAVAEYQTGEADHLHHAVSFYLNFINLLMDFMRIFSSGD